MQKIFDNNDLTENTFKKDFEITLKQRSFDAKSDLIFSIVLQNKSNNVIINLRNQTKKFFELTLLREDLYYLLTLVLGSIFLICQAIEYVEAPFHINDSVYGSAFYMLTGLHGMHVIIGVLFLTVFFIRKQFYISSNLLGLEFSAWYWHFVDVVWIFLYFVIYVGSYFSSTLI